MNCLRKSRRYFLLLEVLLAMAIVTLCVFPLVTPIVAIYRAERKLSREILLDGYVNRLYVDFVKALHRKQISFDALIDPTAEMIEDPQLKAWGFEGKREIELIKSKPKLPETPWRFLFQVHYTFWEKGKDPERLDYTYQFYVEQTPPEEDKNQDEEEKES